MSETEELVFVPLGGVGEIGMNLALYGYGPKRKRRWLAVDMGVSFANDDLPGVDAVLPDISFLRERKDRLDGIVITHAHEDHFGALFDFWPELKVPVIMSPFAAALLEAKRAGEQGAPSIPVEVMRQGGRRKLGPFDVEYVAMSHSIPESNALAIRTGAGLVLHTGDWKLDPTPVIGRPTDVERLKALGEEGVLALICDSTNAIRDGVSPSEADVAVVLERIVAEAKNRVIVTSFASNVARLRSVAVAAQKAGRDVVLIGRAMHRAAQVGAELGYFDGLPPFLDRDAFASRPRHKIVALMTGSQGEPRAALARIATKSSKDVTIAAGDLVVFSSRAIPGNERPINAIINSLIDQGAEVMTDRDGLVHVSGHPRRDELRQLYEWTKPKMLVPVHGEPMHLHAQANLARSVGIETVVEARNGTLARLSPGPAKIIDEAASGRVLRDGKLLLGVEKSGVAERRRLAFSGCVAVTIVLTARGDVAEEPQVALAGLPEEDGSGDTFRSIVEEVVDEAIDALPKARRRDTSVVEETIRRAVRGELETVWGKRPVTLVTITRLSE